MMQCEETLSTNDSFILSCLLFLLIFGADAVVVVIIIIITTVAFKTCRTFII